MLASPQQLHQYCIQLRNWQTSPRAAFPGSDGEKRATPTTARLSLLLEGALRGAEHINAHTHTHYLELCCFQEGEEEREGGTRCPGILQRREPIPERRLVLMSYHAPQGKLSTREFDRISVHLLHAHW